MSIVCGNEGAGVWFKNLVCAVKERGGPEWRAIKRITFAECGWIAPRMIIRNDRKRVTIYARYAVERLLRRRAECSTIVRKEFKEYGTIRRRRQFWRL